MALTLLLTTRYSAASPEGVEAAKSISSAVMEDIEVRDFFTFFG